MAIAAGEPGILATAVVVVVVADSSSIVVGAVVVVVVVVVVVFASYHQNLLPAGSFQRCHSSDVLPEIPEVWKASGWYAYDIHRFLLATMVSLSTMAIAELTLISMPYHYELPACVTSGRLCNLSFASMNS